MPLEPAPVTPPKSPLQESIIFAVQKFLEHSRVIAAEQKILGQHIDQMHTALQKQKVQKFIDSLNV